jgi:hypothetical protein
VYSVVVSEYTELLFWKIGSVPLTLLREAFVEDEQSMRCKKLAGVFHVVCSAIRQDAACEVSHQFIESHRVTPAGEFIEF